MGGSTRPAPSAALQTSSDLPRFFEGRLNLENQLDCCILDTSHLPISRYPQVQYLAISQAEKVARRFSSQKAGFASPSRPPARVGPFAGPGPFPGPCGFLSPRGPCGPLLGAPAMGSTKEGGEWLKVIPEHVPITGAHAGQGLRNGRRAWPHRDLGPGGLHAMPRGPP